MKLHFGTVACGLLLGTVHLRAQTAPPVAPVRPVTENFFGTSVTDPYRYFENLKDPDVSAWFKAQSDYSRAVLDKIPARKALLERITALDAGQTAHVSLPVLSNGYYFYNKRGANDNISKVYVRKGLNGPERLLIDPDAKNPPAGKHNAIDYFVPSQDGSLVEYGLSIGGSEESTLHVIETETGRETDDAIDRAVFGSAVWLPDGKAFFYNRLQKLAPSAPVTDKYQNSRTYLHVLGTDAETDRPILGPGLSLKAAVAPADLPVCALPVGSNYLLGVVEHGTSNERTLYAVPVAEVQAASDAAAINCNWVKVCDVPDAVTAFDVHGDDLYLLTHKDASRFKVVRTRLSHPDIAHAETVVSAGKAVVTGMKVTHDALYVTLRDGGISRLKRVDFANGKTTEVRLPLDGTVAIAGEPRAPGILINLTGWTRASLIYTYDPQTKTVTDTGLQPQGLYDAPPDLISEEVKAKAADGTLIPLSLVYRRDLKRDGSNPTRLEGYGSYGVSIPAFFSLPYLAWMERGGILAFAHVRGGGEYGEDWRKAGQMKTKPNTWNDFIACAEYLVKNKYTSHAKLVGSGRSAGGILIGRAITARPDLFGTACIDVGASNPLRLEFGANGVPNIPEFGSVKTEEGFKALLEMDALHHVKDGVKYPAVLLTTGFNDPRVDSWQPAKMTARLQAATASGKPVLLRVDYDAGHGHGSTRQQQFELLADELAFFFWQAGVPDFQPTSTTATARR